MVWAELFKEIQETTLRMLSCTPAQQLLIEEIEQEENDEAEEQE